jgi:hypothetical protein
MKSLQSLEIGKVSGSDSAFIRLCVVGEEELRPIFLSKTKYIIVT